jgi:Ni/Fe-hydrogenase subunit HybB-like protein
MIAVNGFTLSLLALIVSSIAAPLYYARRWQGLWRLAALIPAIVILFVILRIVVDTTKDPTSHNLWPFEVVMFSAGAFAVIGVLSVARRFLRLDS